MNKTRNLARVYLPILAMLTILFALGATPAAADSITFTLTQGNSNGLDCCSGPFVSVTVDRTSTTTATITFTSLENGGYIYLMGSDAVAVNVNATSFSVGAIVASNFWPTDQIATSLTGFTPGPFNIQSGNPSGPCAGMVRMDGFGCFNLGIESFDGFTHSSTTISFTLTNLSGTWATASDVLTDNALGNDAAVHGFACANTALDPCDSKTGAFATGYASVDGPPVPEPASIALFGSGLMALAGMLRRRKMAAKS